MNPDIAGAGLDANCRAAAVDSCHDMVTVHRPLHSYLVIRANRARAAGRIQEKAFRTRRKVDASGSRGEAPVAGGCSCDANRARAC